MATGADRVAVLTMVLKQGMTLASAGVVIGLLLCAMASRATPAAFSVVRSIWDWSRWLRPR